jgi:hypothetical protein
MKIDLARSPREIQVVANRATSNKIIIRSRIAISTEYLSHSNLEHNIINIILVDAGLKFNASGSLQALCALSRAMAPYYVIVEKKGNWSAVDSSS